MLKITCTASTISLKSPYLGSHCPGPKQEVGNRNSSLFLPLFLLPVMHFAELNNPPLFIKPPPAQTLLKINKPPRGGLIEDLPFEFEKRENVNVNYKNTQTKTITNKNSKDEMQMKCCSCWSFWPVRPLSGCPIT